jgi:S-adenosylmethionine:tRNA ribosyltransferase-isomerase
MIAADHPDRGGGKVLVVSADGDIRHHFRADLGTLFEPGDLVVANDAMTLPASLSGTHLPTGATIEVRLAGWIRPGDPMGFIAVVFGAGDHRMRTEDRPPPPAPSPGDRLALGPLAAIVERTLGHPRLVALSFRGSVDSIWAGIANHGRPIQYAHVSEPLALSQVWTRIAAHPVAFEAPSAGFALDWRTLAAWRSRGVGFATLTHAAGISSTGDAALDARLPFDEPYSIPPATATAIARTRSRGGKIIAIGTTVVRALEAAGTRDGKIHAGDGIATGRIEPETEIKVVDAILSGVHQPGESHFELLRAFADDTALDRAAAELEAHGYRAHEFGDSVLIERRPRLRIAMLSSSGEAKRRPDDPGASIHHADDRPIPTVPGRIITAEFRSIDSRRAASVQK